MKITYPSLVLLLATILSTAAPAQGLDPEKFKADPPSADEVFLQVQDSLDNPRHYCVDVPGFGKPDSGLEGWQTDWPLETHTCKTGITKAHYFFVDQLISRQALTGSTQRVRFTRLNLCMEVMNAGGGPGQTSPIRQDALVLTKECSTSPRQAFTISASGEVKPVLDQTKCLTVGGEAHEAGNRAPGQPWLQRGLTVSRCTPELAPRQHWGLAVPPADPS